MTLLAVTVRLQLPFNGPIPMKIVWPLLVATGIGLFIAAIAGWLWPVCTGVGLALAGVALFAAAAFVSQLYDLERTGCQERATLSKAYATVNSRVAAMQECAVATQSQWPALGEGAGGGLATAGVLDVISITRRRNS